MPRVISFPILVSQQFCNPRSLIIYPTRLSISASLILEPSRILAEKCRHSRGVRVSRRTSSYGTNPETVVTSNYGIGELLYDTYPPTSSTPLPSFLLDIVFKNVVFPAPEGPIIAKNSLGFTPPVTSLRIQRGFPLV